MIEKTNVTMKNLPVQEQPYEKCRTKGPSAMTDAELLSVLIRSGTRGESALDLARRILSMPESSGLAGLHHLTQQQLERIHGIGSVKALQLRCMFELSRRAARSEAAAGLSFHDPGSIADYYMEDFRHEEQEKVLLIMLDSRGALLGEEVISAGTVNAALVTPREIFLTALRYRCVSVILLHNHPSGDPSPSEEDLLLTRRVAKSGELLGIGLLDHIILGDHEAFSFRQENLM